MKKWIIMILHQQILEKFLCFVKYNYIQVQATPKVVLKNFEQKMKFILS